MTRAADVARGLGWRGGAAVAVVVVIGDLASLLSERSSWTAETMWAMDWMGRSLTLFGPLLVGVCALQASFLFRASGGELITSSARGARSAVAVLATGATTVAVAVHTLLLAIAVVTAALRSGSVTVSVWPLLVQWAATGLYCAIGCAVGAMAPRPSVAPLAAAATFAVSLLVYSTLLTYLVEFGGATTSLVGLGYRPSVMLLQLGLSCFAAVGAVLVAARVRRSPRGDSTRWGLRACAIVWSALVVVGLIVGSNRFHPVDVTERCVAGSPTVCTASAYAERLPAWQKALSRLDGRLRRVGIDPGALVVRQATGARPTGSGTGHVVVAPLDRRTRTSNQVVTAFARGLFRCQERELTPRQVNHAFTMVAGVRQYLLDDANTGPGPSGPAATRLQTLARSTPRQREEWTRLALVRLADCRYNQVPTIPDAQP